MKKEESRCAAWRANRAAMLRQARRRLPVSAAGAAAQIGRDIGENATDRTIERNLKARRELRDVA